MNRTLVVGWDAVSWDYVEPLLDIESLPNLTSLMENGSIATLSSTMPPITPVAWSSIITGKLPENHGVYDWTSSIDGQERAATSYSRMGTPFWDRLADERIRVGLVNVPMTYPPQPINGFTLCGFGAPPDAVDLCFPPELKQELEEKLGTIRPVLSPKESESLAASGLLFGEEVKLQERQVEMAIYLAGQYEVDLLVINLMLFDHSNHRSRSSEEVRQALELLDRHLGELLEGYQPSDVVVFADHGSRRVEGEFLIGDWLRDKGYLTRVRRCDQNESELNFLVRSYLSAMGLRVDKFERTVRYLLRKTLPLWPVAAREKFWQSVIKNAPRAYAHYWHSEAIDAETSHIAAIRRTGLVYLNRCEKSTAQPKWQRTAVEALVRDLKSIVDRANGRPIFSEIYRSEELYGEQPLGSPPDLVLDYHHSNYALFTHMGTAYRLQDGYYAMAEDNEDAAIWSWRGDHKHEGICVLSGESFQTGANIGLRSILDLSATLLHLFGVPVPDDYDGRVLSEAFREVRDVRQQTGDAVDRTAARELADGEAIDDAEIVERLRALGYLE